MESIAIVGLGCRFPAASGPEAFWRLLRDGVDAVGEIPAERWDPASFYDPDAAALGKTNTRWGGCLDQIDGFDPAFFRISPREAAHMDPQQRLLLEVAWEALEDAGLPPDSLAGSATGVFAGVMFNEYGGRLMNGDPRRIDAYSGSGNIYAIVANRISYALDLHGPSLVVDTACSSSLVAVHLACRSLRNGECSVALAGGVNVILSPGTPVYYTRAGLMAADGRCKTFDARADGFVRGEGAGMVVLKPLAAALADGDRVYAVIRGSAVNHDGRGNGLTAPNPWAQEAVIRQAYAAAGVSPGQVGYVEAHGSGTALGDPIELKALGAVLAEGRASGRRCAVGSVKTNFGHLEAAAGIAGLIKAVLCLARREIPPSLHFETPNPRIPFASLPLRVASRREPWPEGDGPAIAGVSSFGFGGANAHVVLEAPPAPAPPRPQPEERGETHLLALSARSPEALRALAREHRLRLGPDGPAAGLPLRDLCSAAALRRSHHEHRLAVVCRSREEALEGLAAFLAGQDSPGLTHGRRSPSRRRKVAFLFSGQGPQWWAMGRELLGREPVFRQAVERCDELFAGLFAGISAGRGGSLLGELTADEERSRLHETWIAQPALFALQVALAALWRSWGIEPDGVVGHSVGEVAAACVAGCLSLEEGVRLVFHRGRLMEQAAGLGRMASLELSAEAAAAAIEGYAGRLWLAALNGPSATVVSGEPAALDELLATLEGQGVYCRRIQGTYAFHTPQMEPFRAALVEALDGLAATPGKLPLLPTASWDPAEGWGAAYWGRQLVEPVRFAAAVAGLLSRGFDTFVEVGPHPVLAGAVRDSLHQAGKAGEVLPSLRRGEPERGTLLASLGRLYTLGCAVSWKGVMPAPGQAVDLPLYPWQRERCWVELDEPLSAEAAARRSQGEGLAGLAPGAHPFGGLYLELAGSASRAVWQGALDRGRLSYLEDHQVEGQVILPATAYLETVLAAAEAVHGVAACRLDDLVYERPLAFPAEGAVAVQVHFQGDAAGDAGGIGDIGDDALLVELLSRQGGRQAPWTLHLRARLHLEATGGAVAGGPAEIAAIQARCPEVVAGGELYRLLALRGNQWGPAFRGIDRVWQGEAEALARVVAPETLAEPEAGSYRLHPALLDACFQALAATQPLDEAEGGLAGAFVGAGAERVEVARSGPLPATLWSHARRRSAPEDSDSLVGDVRVLDDSGQLLLEAWGVRFRYLGNEGRPEVTESPVDWLYELEWRPVERGAAPTRPASWLILADRGGVGVALAELLAAAGDEAVLVQEPEEPRRRLAEILAPGRPACGGILDLRSLDAPAAATAAGLSAAHRHASGGAVRLLQILLELDRDELPRLWLVTRGAQAVAAGDPVSLAQAALWGLGRALAQEHAALWGGLVDLDPAQPPAAAAAELLAAVRQQGEEDQLAFRGGTAYAPRLVRAAARAPEGHLRWRLDGSYLITGGLGDLGLRVARWMVEQGARRLVLLGRTPLPPRSEWSSAADPQAAGRIAAIRELEAMGASVHLAAVDVGDEAAVAAFLSRFQAEGWPPLRGVVHAAGVAELRPLRDLDEEGLERPFRAKAVGAWLLHESLRGTPLDFFVLFSSISCLHGAFGQGLAAYAAANAALDALAHERRARGETALSIGWGPWAELGLAARRPGRGEERGRSDGGLLPIPPTAGVELLGALLRRPAAHVAALRADWVEWGRVHASASSSASLSALIAAGARGAEALPDREAWRTMPADERQERLLPLLRSRVAQVLRLPAENFEAQEPLSGVGLDSLAAVEVKNWVEKSFGVVVPMVRFLSGASVADLASEVAVRLGGEGAVRSLPATGEGGTAGAFPLTHGQMALWYLYQVDPGSAAYNVAFAARVRSAVDEAALRRALQGLVDRHASLRTRYTVQGGRPVQVVEPEMAVDLSAVDAAAWGEEELRGRLREAYRAPFDLEKGGLLRARLFSRSSADHALLLTAHHIAVDGWSLFLLLDELSRLYPAARLGAPSPLPPLESEYRDHVLLQQERLAGPEGERLWEFWRQHLRVAPPALELPLDRPRPSVPSGEGATCPFVLDGRLTQGLKALARAEGATLFMVLLAIYQILLHRCSGQAELAVGSTTAGRDRAELAGVVGHFVNAVVLRADFVGDPTFQVFLQRVRRTVLAAFEHQEYPFPLLVERLQPERAPGQAPFFQASLVLQSLPGLGRLPEFFAAAPGTVEPVDFGGLALEPFPIPQQEGQHELELEVYERADSLVGLLQYSTDLFDAATASRIAGQLAALAASAVARPGARVSELAMLSEEERSARDAEESRRRETDLQKLRSSRRRGVSLGAAKAVEAVASVAEPRD